MSSENQRNPHDLGPEPPALPPLIVDGQAQFEHVGGGHNYQVRPEGLSLAGLAHWKWKHRNGRGMPTSPEPIPAAPEYPDNRVGLPDVAEIHDPATADESLWRAAVMHTLGKRYFDPTTLQKRMPHSPDEDLSKIIFEMQNRGIIGHHSRAGYEVLQKHGDSPEAIQSVALHLAQVRARQARNAIEGLERTRRIERNQGTSAAEAQRNYNRGTNRVLQEVQGYASDITSARHSLNIPIPEMHRIINKLEHVGFLRVPITDRGPNFNDNPETNNAEFRRTQKWAQNYAQFERSGSQAFLVGGIDDLQTNLKNVYIKFPAEYDPDSIELPPPKSRGSKGYSTDPQIDLAIRNAIRDDVRAWRAENGYPDDEQQPGEMFEKTKERAKARVLRRQAKKTQ